MKFIKSFNAWGKTLASWQNALLVLSLFLSAVVGHYCLPLGLAAYLIILLLIGLGMREHRNKIVGLGLCVCLLSAPGVQAQSTNVPPQPQLSVPECNPVAAGAVIIVGIYFAYKLWEFCKMHPPYPGYPKHLSPPPTTPAPAPTNSVPTNSIPTNGVTGGTSRFPLINLTSANTVSYDVSSLGWVDNTDTNHPVLFQDYLCLKMASGTNPAGPWTNFYSLCLYLSSNSMESVIYDGSGNPRATNWARGNPYAGTNLVSAIPFDFVNPQEPARFFHW